jgi:hypothetical protein
MGLFYIKFVSDELPQHALLHAQQLQLHDDHDLILNLLVV